jgi:DNA/RNA endonuclease YhcR with UshA esterase domain
MNKLRILTGLILALTLMPLQAHHSTAMFDDQREITVTGIIKEFQYTNPHSWLIIDVTNDDGSVTTWGFEAEGPTTLTRSGIRKSTLPPGTKITITGHPMKDGRSAAAWVVVELEDGTVLNPRAGFVAR